MGRRRAEGRSVDEVFGLDAADRRLAARKRRSIPRWSTTRVQRRWPTTQIADKVAELEPETLDADREERSCSRTLDHHWKEHLATLDALRQVIHLRAYAQKTPINEYKQEAFALFERMLDAIREDVTRTLAHAQFQLQAPPELPDAARLHHHAFRSVHRRRRHARSSTPARSG